MFASEFDEVRGPSTIEMQQNFLNAVVLMPWNVQAVIDENKRVVRALSEGGMIGG